MPRATPLRSQGERTEATVSALLRAARARFASDGYVAASLDAIVEDARLTKGALYHHFTGKPALFRAVYEAEQEAVLAAITAGYESAEDPWAAFEAGCSAFFEVSLDPAVQRITLVDAPVALGWDQMREVEAGLLTLMELGIEQAVSAGHLAARPARPLAVLLFGALCEGVMHAARSPNPASSQEELLVEVRRLLAALLR